MSDGPTAVARLLDFITKSEFQAALWGALVAGGIAWLLQRQNLREAQRQRAEATRERQLTLAHSLLAKLNYIGGHHLAVRRWLDRLEARRSKTNSGLPHEFYTPLQYVDRDVYFSIEEISMLLHFKEVALVNKIQPIDSAYALSRTGLAALNAEKQKLDEFPKILLLEDGERSEVGLDQSQRWRFRPIMMNIDSGYANLVELTDQQLRAAREALDELAAALSKHLNVSIKFDDASPEPSAERTRSPADRA